MFNRWAQIPKEKMAAYDESAKIFSEEANMGALREVIIISLARLLLLFTSSAVVHFST